MIVTMWAGHTDRSRAMATCVREAIDALGWKYDYVAAEMGLSSPAQLSRQLAGVEPLNAWRLAALPDAFHIEYDRRRVALRGGVVLEAPDLSLVRGFCAMPRAAMAKMTRPVTLPLGKREVS